MRRLLHPTGAILLSLLYLATIVVAGTHDHAPASSGPGSLPTFTSTSGPDSPTVAKIPAAHCALCNAGSVHQPPVAHTRTGPASELRISIIERPSADPSATFHSALQRRGPPVFLA